MGDKATIVYSNTFALRRAERAVRDGDRAFAIAILVRAGVSEPTAWQLVASMHASPRAS
jgi:hypothetical protein